MWKLSMICFADILSWFFVESDTEQTATYSFQGTLVTDDGSVVLRNVSNNCCGDRQVVNVSSLLCVDHRTKWTPYLLTAACNATR